MAGGLHPRYSPVHVEAGKQQRVALDEAVDVHECQNEALGAAAGVLVHAIGHVGECIMDNGGARMQAASINLAFCVAAVSPRTVPDSPGC